MKRIGIVVLLVLGFISAAWAYETWVGRITASTTSSKNNLTTNPNFQIPNGAVLSVQCDQPACVRASTGGDAGVVTCGAGAATRGPQLLAGQLFDIRTSGDINSLAVVAADGGTVNCDVYQLLP